MTESGTYTFAIASGKGGTGKTLVATSVASLLATQEHVALIDCDVETPNDHLFLSTTSRKTHVVETLIASIEPSLCTSCGTCRELCAYGAPRIFGSMAMVFAEMCHGCGLCVAPCPTGAMQEIAQRVGEVSIGTVDGSEGLTLVTGRLDVGQVKTPAVIRSARAAAESLDVSAVILDCPPGVACASVAAMRGADAALLVAEPTIFGLHDLELSLRLCNEMDIPTGVLLNRDTGEVPNGLASLIKQYDAPLVGRIPFDRRIAETYAHGEIPCRVVPGLLDILEKALCRIRELARTDLCIDDSTPGGGVR